MQMITRAHREEGDSVLDTVRWGILSGTTQVVDGLISLFSVGFFAGHTSWEATMWLTEQDAKRYRAKMAVNA